MKPETPTSDDKLPFFLKQNAGFGQIGPQDDLLHPESFAQLDDPTATETQYFGFSIPEKRIHALCYLWWHPNLKVCSGGLFVFQGIKPTTVHAELCDWRVFMSDAAITRGDLHEYRLANGYGVRVVEPLRRFRLDYADPANGNAVDLDIEAVLPPVMFADGKHFEQTMRVRGELTLRGERHRVESYTVRDRSWGKPRPEANLPLPPMSWMVGTFDDTFSFNCNMFDHASGQPERGGAFVNADEQALNGGWVWRDGKLGRVVKGYKRVTRAPGSTVCSAIELRLDDEHGRQFDLRATLVASCPIQVWTNVWMGINLMRWECDGRVGYGDAQEAFWNPYLSSAAFRTS